MSENILEMTDEELVKYSISEMDRCEDTDPESIIEHGEKVYHEFAWAYHFRGKIDSKLDIWYQFMDLFEDPKKKDLIDRSTLEAAMTNSVGHVPEMVGLKIELDQDDLAIAMYCAYSSRWNGMVSAQLEMRSKNRAGINTWKDYLDIGVALDRANKGQVRPSFMERDDLPPIVCKLPVR
jgi:hypothetical protein